jgi:hypothetical protein
MSLSDVYEQRHYAPGYVYIAGSLSGRLLKIGVTKNIHRQEKYLQTRRYGNLTDWSLLYYLWLDDNAGDIEHQTRKRLQKHKVIRDYLKDGRLQRGRELVECSFSMAFEALSECVGDAGRERTWRSSFAGFYEFDE